MHQFIDADLRILNQLQHRRQCLSVAGEAPLDRTPIGAAYYLHGVACLAMTRGGFLPVPEFKVGQLDSLEFAGEPPACLKNLQLRLGHRPLSRYGAAFG